MAYSRVIDDPASVTRTQCMAQWREGVPCFNHYTHVVEVIGKAGYGKFCAQHMDGYRNWNREGEGRTWIGWTCAEWERTGRGLMLDIEITFNHGRGMWDAAFS